MNFTEIDPINKAFRMMAREQKFDVSEMAIVSYLQAKAYGKPLTLMPATMLGRFQHGAMLYNSERGTVRPQDLPGRRVGVRAFTQTTGVWLRGILSKDYGLDLGKVQWVTFEDAHLAEYSDPPGVERVTGKDMTKMLLEGELDAAIYGGVMPTDPRLKSVIADPEAAAEDWYARSTASCRSITWSCSRKTCQSRIRARCASFSACCSTARRPPACRRRAPST